jgi:hypothetical protein
METGRSHVWPHNDVGAVSPRDHDSDERACEVRQFLSNGEASKQDLRSTENVGGRGLAESRGESVSATQVPDPEPVRPVKCIEMFRPSQTVHFGPWLRIAPGAIFFLLKHRPHLTIIPKNLTTKATIQTVTN